MDKKTAGLVGAISALTPLAAAAATLDKPLAEVMAPQSYAELLQPIPNASALLKEELAAASKAKPEPRIQTAQYYGYPDGPYYHHHHHHHHHHYRGWGYPYYHHHHHHHHHHHWYWYPY
jgi:hypothetical protein